MTARDDLDRQLDDFLRDGPAELPATSFYAVRDRTERTRQRAVLGPWRLPSTMNRFVPIGLGAAAVVAVLLVGTQLLGPGTSSGVGGPATSAPSPTAAPTATPAPTASPSSTGLSQGPFRLWGASGGGVPMIVTIPASGWFGENGGGILTKNENADPPGGSGLIVFSEGDWYVPADPCHWLASMPKTASTSADDLVAALGAQADRAASTPEAIELGGHAGKSIVLHVPDDAAFGTCDQRQFCTLANPTQDQSAPCFRYAQGPGQIDTLSVLDVGDATVVLDAATYAGTPATDAAELRQIVSSVTFE